METSENKAGIPTPFHLFYAFQAYNKKPILSIQHSKPMLFFTHGKAHIALRACKPPPCARALCQRGTQFAFGLDVLKVFEFWIFEISKFLKLWNFENTVKNHKNVTGMTFKLFWNFEFLNFWIWTTYSKVLQWSSNDLRMTQQWPSSDLAMTFQRHGNDLAMTWQWPGNDLAMT